MIDVKNLTKVYPGVMAVNDISFQVDRGEIIGFLGPNGAGKSTTMRILTCFLAPTSGSVTVAGADVLTQSMDVRRRIGYLPENNPLYTEMRVEDYLMFRARIKQVPRRERGDRVSMVIAKCGLGDRRHAIIQNLSKGYRQRVGIADAIVSDPEIIIFDEPTIGLDPNQVRAVRELIRDLGQRHTVILSTHILSEVEKTCTRVLIVNRGRLVANGTPASIVQKFTVTGRVRIELRGTGNGVKETLETLPGVRTVVWTAKGDHHYFVVEALPGVDLRSPLFKCAAERNWEVVELGYERVSLEDAFVELTIGTKPIVDSGLARSPGITQENASPAP